MVAEDFFSELRIAIDSPGAARNLRTMSEADVLGGRDASQSPALPPKESEPRRSWRFNQLEKIAIASALLGLIVFGAIIEFRTALRRVPMTDLGVFSCASWAAWHGEDIYNTTDWHGWHYQYPPALAILFAPLQHPLPQKAAANESGDGLKNIPWGCKAPGRSYYGLHHQNSRFFLIVAIWYWASVALAIVSIHILACVLDGSDIRGGVPGELNARVRWWCLRLIPLLCCLGSLGTDLSRGQVDILMLAAIAIGLYLLAQRREISAGIALAFPATVKLFPPLLLLYPVWRRQWRAATGVLAGAILFLMLAPVLAFGASRTISLYGSWFEVLATPALGTGTDQSRAKELTGMNSTDNQSLLAAIHNWHYHEMPRKTRPKEATPAERSIVYATGAVLVLATVALAGARRQDNARELLLICGMLVGLALVISPIVHNYYYLLMLPILTAISDAALPQKIGQRPAWGLLAAITAFGILDVLTRMPAIGPKLRDVGVPLLAILLLLFISAALLVRGRHYGLQLACSQRQFG